MAPTLQFPQGDEVFLDHVAIFVPEFDGSSKVFERLGFLLTPLAVHESALKPGAPLTPLGTANRCAMLREGYLEMLGAVSEAPMGQHIRRRLARYPGLHLIALSACEPERWHRRLSEKGLNPDPVARIQRSTPTPSGPQLIRGTIVRPPVDSWPEARVQMVFHETPEIMWPEAYLDHANGAEAVTALLIVADDVAATIDRFSRMTGRAASGTKTRQRIALDRGSLLVVDAEEAGRLLPGLAVPTLPFFAAVAIRSDTRVSAAHFARAGVPYTETVNGLQVNAAHGLGATLVFHETGSLWDG